MINTLKMLVRANLGNSTRFEVSECRDLKDGVEVHQDWWVVDANTGDPVITENTLEEAEIYCGLANLLDTDDFDELSPYLRELLPQWFGAEQTTPAAAVGL